MIKPNRGPTFVFLPLESNVWYRVRLVRSNWHSFLDAAKHVVSHPAGAFGGNYINIPSNSLCPLPMFLTFSAHGLKKRAGVTSDDLHAWETASSYAVRPHDSTNSRVKLSTKIPNRFTMDLVSFWFRSIHDLLLIDLPALPLRLGVPFSQAV